MRVWPLVVGVMALLARTARADELTPAERTWTLTCVTALTAASARERESAAAALSRLGPPAVPVILSAVSALKTDEQWAALESAFVGMGAAGALKELEKAERAWPAAATARKRVLIEHLRTAATTSAAPGPAGGQTPPLPPKQTLDFEESVPWEKPSPGTLGTMGYPPTKRERPHFDKAFGSNGERSGGRVMSMPRETESHVGWLGVVRGIKVMPDRKETRLLVENKYFDGLTDTHILCVSFTGGGDFVAVLPGTGHDVKPLALVRVYGRVTSVKDDVPRVAAEYVRQFDQGTYCFMSVDGKPAGNQEWRKLSKVSDDDIYSAFPTAAYYVERLGRREDFAPGKVDVPTD